MSEQKETFPVPEEKQIQWSDAGDIIENLLKGTASYGADYTLAPLEWAFGHNISKDLLGIPEYEDWNQEYRRAFKEGDFGALRHIDKLSHVTGFIPALGAYRGITKLPKGMEIAKRYFPAFKYFDDLIDLNKIMRAKNKIPKKSGIWNAIKNFGVLTGQTVGRPVRHAFNRKRWKKEFDKFDDIAPGVGVPRSHKLTSYPERQLAKNIRDHIAIFGGTGLGVEGIKSLVHSEEPWVSGARAAELPSNSNYQDPIMKMVQPKPRISIEFDHGYVDDTGTIQPK